MLSSPLSSGSAGAGSLVSDAGLDFGTVSAAPAMLMNAPAATSIRIHPESFMFWPSPTGCARHSPGSPDFRQNDEFAESSGYFGSAAIAAFAEFTNEDNFVDYEVFSSRLIRRSQSKKKALRILPVQIQINRPNRYCPAYYESR